MREKETIENAILKELKVMLSEGADFSAITQVPLCDDAVTTVKIGDKSVSIKE